MRLENKVALISGGARGMGAVEAQLFVNEGGRVVIGDILEEEGRRTEAKINESGGECIFVRLDVTNEASWQQAVAATVARIGKLDVLVNNAGIFRTEGVLETSEELWDQVMEINAKGVFLGTKHAIPEMRRAGGRLHRQHLVGGGPDRRRRLGRLPGVQRRRAFVHQGHRHPVRR